MSKFILVTESGSDLAKEYIDRYNIKIVPMHVSFGVDSFDDSELKASDVFEFYDKNKLLPKTSGSTPSDFVKVFSEINREYPDCNIIYCIFFSYNSFV